MWWGTVAAYEQGVDGELDLQVVPGPPDGGHGGTVWTLWASGSAGLDGPTALHKDGPGFLVQLPNSRIGVGRVVIGVIAVPAAVTGATTGVVTLTVGARSAQATYGHLTTAVEGSPTTGVAFAERSSASGRRVGGR